MPKLVAIDTGPIVGLFNGSDQHHSASVAFFAGFKDRGFTTVACIKEAMFLLDFSQLAQMGLLEWLQAEALEIVNISTSDWPRIQAVMRKYADLPADFADASLVAVCERLQTRVVASSDRDFSVFRYKDQQSFRNVFH
jgi:predicted nucleic acid-binding protein